MGGREQSLAFQDNFRDGLCGAHAMRGRSSTSTPLELSQGDSPTCGPCNTVALTLGSPLFPDVHFSNLGLCINIHENGLFRYLAQKALALVWHSFRFSVEKGI